VGRFNRYNEVICLLARPLVKYQKFLVSLFFVGQNKSIVVWVLIAMTVAKFNAGAN